VKGWFASVLYQDGTEDSTSRETRAEAGTWLREAEARKPAKSLVLVPTVLLEHERRKRQECEEALTKIRGF
jgi:hypothetical protein